MNVESVDIGFMVEGSGRRHRLRKSHIVAVGKLLGVGLTAAIFSVDVEDELKCCIIQDNVCEDKVLTLLGRFIYPKLVIAISDGSLQPHQPCLGPPSASSYVIHFEYENLKM